MKILYLGNSITKHSPAPDIGWNGNWGMAASVEENDYVHVLNRMIENSGKHVDAMIRNIADFERGPETIDETVFAPMKAFRPDVIILRAVENVADDKLTLFKDACIRLLRYLNPDYEIKVFCTGSFWKRDAAEKCMKEAASSVGAVFISLETLHSQSYQAIGQFEHGGVASHPSDFGMQSIAKLIYPAIEASGLLDTAKVYPIPEGEPESNDYSVTVDGQKAGCYTCRVSAAPFNRVWPGQQRPIEQSELASFVYFDMSSPAELEVTIPHDFNEAVIRPRSNGIVLSRDGRRLNFTISRPGQFSLEIDGRHHNLHIFANPVDHYKKDEHTLYFGPGVHNPGTIRLRSGDTLFVDAGAVIHAAISAKDAENVRIIGHGIIDYSTFERHDPLIWEEDGLINLVRCENVRIDGVILRDSSWWTITAFNCLNLRYNNVKSIGMWRYNSDGFDFVNSQNVHVSNCFLRNFDDVIVFKGVRFNDYPYEKLSLRNYLIENCVLWCDWGGALEIGAETVADEYCNLVYRGCDIIRNSDGGMRIHSGDRAVIHNVLYDKISVEYNKYDRASVYQQSDEMKYEPADVPHCPDFIKGWMYCNTWSTDGIFGNIYDVTYRDIDVYTDDGMPVPAISFSGANPEHIFDRITLENIRINGEKTELKINKNEFTGEITVK